MITGKQQVFGGKNIIILGDDSQIKPVRDTPLFDKFDKKNNPISNQGKKAYESFKDVIFLDQLMRQEYVEPIPNTPEY
jgi:hypothetical protein